MKKLYRKGTVHPSPPTISDHHLSFLPATILTLTTALSPQDREVLAYLLSSCSSSTHPLITTSRRITPPSPSASSSKSNGGDFLHLHHMEHPPMFSCDCFRCYMSYWVRWDESPNRQLIHDIIDAYEDGLVRNNKGKNKKDRKTRNSNSFNNKNKKKKEKVDGGGRVGTELIQSELESNVELDDLDGGVGSSCGGGEEEGNGGGEVVEERGSVRRFMNFIGERIWGVWN